jgi:carbon storage regulator CsrA
MLVLSRKVSQQVQIGPDISITVVRIDHNHVRLGITAPPGVAILREELLTRRHEPESKNRAAVPAARRPVRAS